MNDVVGFDIGIIEYYYPDTFYLGTDGNRVKADTTEAYAGVNFRFVSLKYFYALSDWFGVNESTYIDCGIQYDTTDCHGVSSNGSNGSSYLDLTLSQEFGEGWGVLAHAGQQKVSGYEHYDYLDWKIAISKRVQDYQFAIAYVDTDAKAGFYNASNAAGHREVLSDSGLILSVLRSF